jgi:hypothetical protein
MKPLLFCILLLLQICCFGQGLTIFIQNNKIGYLDSTGKIIIQPTYESGGNFSEGLAAVRVNGKHGYIDTKATWVIDPQYEYATEFVNGIAIVYSEGIPHYINKQGKLLFKNKFPILSMPIKGKAFAGTASGNFALIDIQGNMLTDTFFFECSVRRRI